MAQVAWATLQGEVGSQLGYAVGGVGDITGDERADVIAVAPWEVFGADDGVVYLLASPVPAGATSVRLSGARLVDRDPGTGMDDWLTSGYGSMLPLDDVSGDGIAELVLASLTHQPVLETSGWGTVYIVDDAVGAQPATEVPTDPSYGWITGTDAGYFATSAAVGDVDGDDVQDLLVGSPKKEDDDGAYRGRVYVYLGPVPAIETDQSTANFTIYGDNPLPIIEGGPVAMGVQVLVGDVSADGVNDVVVTSPTSVVDGSVGAGEAYVFEGPILGDVASSSAVGTIQGDSTVMIDYLGTVANWLGDTDGDGYEEFGLNSNGGPEFFPVGHTYVFDGPVVGTVRALDRADTHFEGAEVGDLAFAIASAGDLDQDGLRDVAIGAIALAGDARGAVVLYYGALPSGSHLVNESPDAVLWGEGGWPHAIAATDDIDGDCMPDIAVGARMNDKVYILRGGTL